MFSRQSHGVHFIFSFRLGKVQDSEVKFKFTNKQKRKYYCNIVESRHNKRGFKSQVKISGT